MSSPGDLERRTRGARSADLSAPRASRIVSALASRRSASVAWTFPVPLRTASSTVPPSSRAPPTMVFARPAIPSLPGSVCSGMRLLYQLTAVVRWCAAVAGGVPQETTPLTSRLAGLSWSVGATIRTRWPPNGWAYARAGELAHNCSAAVIGYGTRPWTSCRLDLTSLVAGHAASPVALVVGTTFAFGILGIKDVEARSAGRPSLT